MSKWRRFGEVLLAGVMVDAVIYAALYLWNWKSTKSVKGSENVKVSNIVTVAKDDENVKEIYTYSAIFFPEERIPCRYHYESFSKGFSGCTRKDCEYSHEAPLMDHLITLLKTTETSLDVCVYLITCYELCVAILDVHSRGVSVRIITDGNFSDNSNSKVGKFRAKGIPIRCNEPGFLMHHKFLILDSKVLINGSFNWTWQAITGNSENLLTTNNPLLVRPYVDEFDNLWNKFGKSTTSKNPLKKSF